MKKVTDDASRQEAIIELLALPDESCMRRGYHYTQAGGGDSDIIKRDLGTAYVEHRRQDHADISCVVSVRRQERLKIVKRA